MYYSAYQCHIAVAELSTKVHSSAGQTIHKTYAASLLIAARVPKVEARPVKTPFYYRRPIRWGDTDAAGIVFTAHYFDICMEAIESWFLEVLELDWFAMTRDHGIGSPFVHAEVDFQAPLTPRDTLLVRVDVERQGNSSLSLVLAGSRERDDQGAFTGRFTCCFNDLASFTKTPIPDALRRRIDDYQRRCAE